MCVRGCPPRSPAADSNPNTVGLCCSPAQAQSKGYFAEKGLTVCYNQVAGSGPQFAALYAGTYNIISTTTGGTCSSYVPLGGIL
jgi:ABC-type nitrate/sulfonate/bicarbonate transport system substrate-binding protein